MTSDVVVPYKRSCTCALLRWYHVTYSYSFSFTERGLQDRRIRLSIFELHYCGTDPSHKWKNLGNVCLPIGRKSFLNVIYFAFGPQNIL